MNQLSRLWDSLPLPVRARAKAIAAAVGAAVGAYVITAILHGDPWTLHGIEDAAGAAFLAGISAHQIPNKLSKQRARRELAGPDGHITIRRHVPEHVVAGRRLGRHVHHDSRSLSYLVQPDGTAKSVTWPRHIPILNQGSTGSCTANAAVGQLGCDPLYPTLPATAQGDLTESFAVAFYSAEETADGDGPYPPNDNGSSGLTSGKIAKAEGLISGYVHITSVAAAKTAIQSGPFSVGSDWYSGMDTPDASGLVTATGTVRGGHEYLCRQYDADKDLWWFDNSWGTSYGVGGRFCYSSATFAKLLASQGDATQFVPLAAPAPTPAPHGDADQALAVELHHLLGLSSTSKAAKADFQAWLTAKNL